MNQENAKLKLENDGLFSKIDNNYLQGEVGLMEQSSLPHNIFIHGVKKINNSERIVDKLPQTKAKIKWQRLVRFFVTLVVSQCLHPKFLQLTEFKLKRLDLIRCLLPLNSQALYADSEQYTLIRAIR